MKKALNFGSGLAAILAIALLTSTLGSKKNLTVKLSAPAFAGFPVMQPRNIELSASDEAIRQLSRREYSDQVKDWLLTTIVSDAGLSPADLNQSLFDLPPVRYGYIRPVGSFEYGDTRSRSIGNGRLVALIPVSDSTARQDALAQIADEARKNTGDTPATVLVFQYQVSPDNLSAEVTRLPDVDAKSLFTAESGYFETTVKGLDDLRDFMSRTDDLTFGRIDSGALWLAGRKLQSHHHHNITLDDAAALWSAQMKLRTRNNQFERFVAQKEQEFKSRWSHRQYQDEMERVRLESERDTDKAGVVAEIDRERERLGVVSHTGFSLDPSFVYSKVQSELEGPAGRSVLTRSAGRVSAGELAHAADEAGSGKLDAFYALLQKMDPQLARSLVQYLKAKCSYQAARYDGALQGTEVGMVLFYTDLLAKLWALDFMGSAPDRYISDFRSMSHAAISPIYATEMDELPSTRLWFGVQSRGFSMKDAGSSSIMLAPVATRLYAASSDSLVPGKEVAPNAASAAFLGWWDDHYAEVARFEPEYERLNEIMKWSIVISWLDQRGQLERLSPLGSVNFRKDNWFADWVREHPDLRFQQWDRIAFFPRGFAKTEALPLLHSDPGVPYPLMGGVSLAEREIFQTRGAISEEIAEIGRRPTLNWSESTPDLFRTIEGAEYKFAETEKGYTVNAALKTGTKFRAVDAEVADLHYSRSIEFDNAAVRMEAQDSGAAIGELKIERAANSFRVSWQSREFDTATSLARKLSGHADPAAALASDSRVAASAQTGDHEFLVRLHGSSKWLKLATNREEGANLAAGWQSRVAPVDPGARSVDLAWYSDDKAAAELGGGFVRVRPPAAQSEGVRLQVGARPPPGVADTSVQLEGHGFHAQRDGATGDYFVRWSDLPAEVRDRPEMLRGIGATHAAEEAPRGINEIAAGDWPHAADDLSHSPLMFKAALDQHYFSGLKYADTLLEQGDEGAALRFLDDLSRVHGNTPEIALRRAIALTKGSVERTARVLNDSLKLPLRDRQTLFNEINARIGHAASDGERDALYRIASFGDWNDLRFSANFRDGTPIAVVDKGKLQIEFHAGRGLKANRVPDLPAGEVPIYVQDSPGLSNLDSPAAIQQALHDGVQGRVPVVLKMSQEDIAAFRPAKIYTPDGKTSLRQLETASNAGSKVPSQGYRAYANRPCPADDTRTDCGGQRQPVYLVIDRQQAEKFN